MIGYEFEYFSFLIIAVLFSAGNAKKNVFTVFTDPIVTIDVLVSITYKNCPNFIAYPRRTIGLSSSCLIGYEFECFSFLRILKLSYFSLRKCD